MKTAPACSPLIGFDRRRQNHHHRQAGRRVCRQARVRTTWDLITLDAYRMGAHEQLRAYGRILGVPVHMAHDRAALEDLLELLAGKKLILIDTAGMPQRDARCKELLDMLAHPSIQKLLVVNTAAQGDAIEDVMLSYQATNARRDSVRWMKP